MKILNRLRFPVFFWFALTMLTFSVLAADMTMPCSRCGTSIPFEPNTDYCHGYRVVCPNCGESYAPRHSWLEASRIPATCTAAGSVSYVCGTCDETKSEPFAALGHDWQVTDRKDATCTAPGFIDSVCLRCGREATSERPPLAEDHTWTETSRTSATCTTAGTVNYTCFVCNETKSEPLDRKSVV